MKSVEWDWEDLINEEELEAAWSLADSLSSSFKRRKACVDDDGDTKTYPSNGRRLPDWGPITSVSTNQTTRSLNSLSAGRLISDGRKDPNGSPRIGYCHSLPSPCRFNPKVKYPTLKFGGHIAYCRTFPEVEKATMELMEMIKAQKVNMDQISLGLDIEWRPIFRRGEALRKAAVMQICMGSDFCYVIHIIHSGIPPILQSLLEDGTSVKVGVGIASDAKKVMKDYNVRIKVLEDLSDLANLKLGGAPKKWGLASLVETLISKQLEKPETIRLGNWEANTLSKVQLEYAATDAYASWYLHQVLKSFPDAVSNQVVEESERCTVMKKGKPMQSSGSVNQHACS